MPDVRRDEKTTLKTRLGGLPAPTHDSPTKGLGDGTSCDGCGETIVPTDPMLSVDVRGVLSLHFHDSCYEAWMRFKH
jgi:hypothetical protein